MKETFTQWPRQEVPADLEARLLHNFVNEERPTPARPQWSHTSVVIIRKQVLPYYFAIYDHDLHRFTELQYREARNAPLHRVAIPATGQPPPPGGA
jgi:hypothetical protein